ncbi:hypothetical protein D9M69_652170 [compost metagenome]
MVGDELAAGAAADAAGAAGLAVAGLAVDSLAGLAAVSAALAPFSAPATAGAVVPLLPPRKSVTYQPEPLSWKPAAVSCFWKLAWPQAGQMLNGSSDIFCNTSLAWPQDAHL